MDLVTRTQEDTTLVVNVLGNNLHQTLHARVDRETASVLEKHGHRRALVQNTKLTLGTLGVGRVSEDTTVKKGSVSVSNHATNVTGAVRLAVTLGVLQAVEVFVAPLVPVLGVTLVNRVDGAGGRKLHVGVGQDKLAQRVLQGETIDTAAAHGDDQLGGGTVHGESRGNQAGTGVKQVLGANGLAGTKDLIGQLEDTEDSTDGDTSVQVGRTVDRVADHGVTGIGVLVELDHLLLFLGNDDAALARAPHGGNKDIIANYIKLFLVITSSVGGTCQTSQVDQGSASDIVGDRFEGELQGVAQQGEVTRGLGVLALFFSEETGESHNIGVDILLTNGRSIVCSHDCEFRGSGKLEEDIEG